MSPHAIHSSSDLMEKLAVRSLGCDEQGMAVKLDLESVRSNTPTAVGEAIASALASSEYDRVYDFALLLDQKVDETVCCRTRADLYIRCTYGLALVPTLHACRRALQLGLRQRILARADSWVLDDLSLTGLAARFAQAQCVDVLLDILRGHQGASPQWHELLSLWVQERVLRHDDVEGIPQVETFWNQNRLPRLSPLPLARLECEKHLVLPTHVAENVRQFTPPPVPNGVASQSENVTVLEYLDEVIAIEAIEHWQWKTSARRYCFASPQRTVSAKLLQELGHFDSGDSRKPQLSVEGVTFSSAFALLFWASNNPSCSGFAPGAARGRAAAWQSIAVMLGHSTANIAELAKLAETFSWYSITSHSWFAHLGWDLGLASLSADGTNLAVVAATDSD